MTAIPDTGTWYNGPLDTSPQQYDVLVAARGNIKNSPAIQTRDASISTQADTVDLIVTPYETPDFFTLNGQRKLVVAEPRPMGVITMPAGNEGFVKIEIKSINEKDESSFTDLENRIYLGIRQYETIDSTIGAGDMSAYVGLSSMESVEFVPLISSTSGSYTAIEPGTEYPISGSDYPTSGVFNFGSVFRVETMINSSRWIKMIRIYLSNPMLGNVKVGVGPVTNQSGETFDNQILSVNVSTGEFSRSSYGIHWFRDMGSAEFEDTGAQACVYGNGVWCVSRGNHVYLSNDGGKSWQFTPIDGIGSYTVAEVVWADNAFMLSAYVLIGPKSCQFMRSLDCKVWEALGGFTYLTRPANCNFLVYGNNKWISGHSYAGGSYYEIISLTSLENKTWESVNAEIEHEGGNFASACFAHGYFYLGFSDGLICRSGDGVIWKKFARASLPISQIIFFNDMLYVLPSTGNWCSIGIFNPDGTLDPDPDL